MPLYFYLCKKNIFLYVLGDFHHGESDGWNAVTSYGHAREAPLVTTLA